VAELGALDWGRGLLAACTSWAFAGVPRAGCVRQLADQAVEVLVRGPVPTAEWVMTPVGAGGCPPPGDVYWRAVRLELGLGPITGPQDVEAGATGDARRA
jgi:hypothetical protein